MTHIKTAQWLKSASVFCIIIGLAMAMAPFTFLIPALNIFLDLAHLPLDGTQQIDSDTEALLSAISGGLLCGLGVAVWLITEHFYVRDPALARRVIGTILLAWYIPDSLGSLAAGAWFNVVMNSGFLALFLVPILMASKTQRAAA
ncbi:excinuclease ABC subunit A [Tropicibacter sp. Alg240-R139]|uniref:excinuclease ABC subunit A n=1 Tax=Tropicibacter sp. Alg240-R139 TaxID=2305991 RepID=UPI0013DF1F6F|nr:excinuclease ABC subunit A [Tropicibacter sp. Alg240-R139]